MNGKQRYLIENHLNNLEINVDMTGLNICDKRWGTKDFVPTLNKIYFIEQGNLFFDINNKQFYAHNNHLVLLPSNTTQTYYINNGNDFTHYWVHFTCNIGNDNLLNILELPYYINLKETNKIKEVTTIFKQMIACSQNINIRNALKLKNLLLDLIIFYIDNSNYCNIIFPNHSLAKMQKVINFIETNFDKTLSINDLAKVAHLHPNYLINLFTTTVGTSPNKYINQLKLKKAKQLLLNTNDSISTIACSLGYSDVYYFSKKFKEYTGMCPSSFRKMM